MTYVFTEADITTEAQRLRDQSAALDPLTARLLRSAGLEPGMRVLDIGCGVGSVTALAADAVAPGGHVVGIDRSDDAVAGARALLGDRDDVEFRVADANDLDGVEKGFDAVIGRMVLVHVPDPVAVLRTAADHVRPGGVICMHEPDMTYAWTSRPTPLWSHVRDGILTSFDHVGAHSRLGRDLFSVFRDAGLSDPEQIMEAPVGGGAASPAFGWANAYAALLPLMESVGIDVDETVPTEGLTEALDADAAAHNGTVIGPLMYGAWTRVPG